MWHQVTLVRAWFVTYQSSLLKMLPSVSLHCLITSAAALRKLCLTDLGAGLYQVLAALFFTQAVSSHL